MGALVVGEDVGADVGAVEAEVGTEEGTWVGAVVGAFVAAPQKPCAYVVPEGQSLCCTGQSSAREAPVPPPFFPVRAQQHIRAHPAGAKEPHALLPLVSTDDCPGVMYAHLSPHLF